MVASAMAVYAVLVPLTLLALWRLARLRRATRQRAALRSDRIAKAAIDRAPARVPETAADGDTAGKPRSATNVVPLSRPH
jgi:hypothetical protein